MKHFDIPVGVSDFAEIRKTLGMSMLENFSIYEKTARNCLKDWKSWKIRRYVKNG